MISRLSILLLIISLAGCGADSKKDSDSNDSKKKQASNNAGKKNDTGKNDTGNKKDSRAKKEESKDSKNGKTPSGSSRVRTDGIFAASGHTRDMNKLKMLAIGAHNYHDAFRKFPMVNTGTETVNKDLSWRVLILPFLEYSNEFDKFDVSQPWNSEKNKPLADSSAKEAYTMGNGNLICAIKNPMQPKSFRDIIDGSSNTIAFMENPTADGDKWTQPVDLDAKDAVKIIKSLKKGEFLLAAFYDGSVQKIYSIEGKNLKDEDVAALFGHRDGTPINDDVFGPSK